MGQLIYEYGRPDCKQTVLIVERSTLQTVTSLEQFVATIKDLLCVMTSTWILWLSDNGGSETWEKSLKQLGVVNSASDFNDLYKQLPKPSELVHGVGYHLFKDELVPDLNQQHGKGGRWVISEKFRHLKQWTVNEMWYSICKAVVEGKFKKYGEQICGVYAKIRTKTNKVSLWTKDASLEEENRAIGRIFRSVVGCNVNEHITYFPPIKDPPSVMTNTWMLWLSDNGGSETWEQSLKQLGVVKTLKEFDDLHEQLPKPSELVNGLDYYLFKDGLIPDWKHPEQHENGGRWVVYEKFRYKKQWTADKMWYSMCKAVIEGKFKKYGDHICGVQVKIRHKTNKLLLWTQEAKFGKENEAIGGILKSVIECSRSEQISPIDATDSHRNRSTRADKSERGQLLAPPAKCLKPMELLEGLMCADGEYAFSCAFTLWFLMDRDFAAVRKKLTNEKFMTVVEAMRLKTEKNPELRDELMKILCILTRYSVIVWENIDKKIREPIVDILHDVLNEKTSKSEACRNAVRLLAVCESDSDKSIRLLDGCIEMLKKDYNTVTVVEGEIVEYSCMLIGLLFRNERVQAKKEQHVFAHYIIAKAGLMQHIMNHLVKHNPADADVQRDGMKLTKKNTVEVFVWEYIAEFLVDVMFFSHVQGIVYLYKLGFFDYIFDLFDKPNHQGRFKAARFLDEAFEKDKDFFRNVISYHNAKSMAKMFMKVLHDPSADSKRVSLVLSFAQQLFAKADSSQLKDLCENR
ncbi:hypothetical protein QR680_006298 [Steinernema hermaphroditum]|uniref:Uncharacterized protein n=1 Tax=Steinernema hermaphroditum TaxID=289476 RepID=A0AA39HUY6_9BILA|nr:hypothetical protein QR680_006298 [Steinernema hermaphroditum]